MSGWSSFWASLEQQAVPHVRAELAKLGWKLTGTHLWRAVADHGRSMPRFFETVTTASPDDLLARVRYIESEKKCCDGECPECLEDEADELDHAGEAESAP